MNEDMRNFIIICLALATVLKVMWPIVEGIGKSMVEGAKVILTLVFIGGGLLALGSWYFGG